jgi:hypothetical protein
MNGEVAQCSVWGSSSYEAQNTFYRPAYARWLTRWLNLDGEYWIRAAESKMNLSAGTISVSGLKIIAAQQNPADANGDFSFTLLFSAFESGTASCGLYLVTIKAITEVEWVSRYWYSNENTIQWAQKIAGFTNASGGFGSFKPNLWCWDEKKNQLKYSCIHAVASNTVTVKIYWMSFNDLLNTPNWWLGNYNFDAVSPASISAGRAPSLGAPETLLTYTLPANPRVPNPDGRVMTNSTFWNDSLGLSVSPTNFNIRDGCTAFLDNYVYILAGAFHNTSANNRGLEYLMFRCNRATGEVYIREVYKDIRTANSTVYDNFTVRPPSYIGGACHMFTNASTTRDDNWGIARYNANNSTFEMDSPPANADTEVNGFPSIASSQAGAVFVGTENGDTCMTMPFQATPNHIQNENHSNQGTNWYNIQHNLLIPSLVGGTALAYQPVRVGAIATNEHVNICYNPTYDTTTDSYTRMPGIAAYMHPWTLITKRNLAPSDWIVKDENDTLVITWRVREVSAP